MAFLSPAQLLLAIAAHEGLEATRAALPDLTLEEARQLLRGAAAALQRQAAPRADAAPSEPVAAKRAPAKAPRSKPPAPKDPPAPEKPGAAEPSVSGGGTGKVRVFSDGAARGNPGPAGAGAVLLDERGHVLARLGRFLGKQTNNVAEYQGLLLGLRHAKELGAREIDVRADSELMIRQLEGRYQVKHPGLRPLHAEAMRLLRLFDKHTLRHIPRAENGLADEMSNRAIDEEL